MGLERQVLEKSFSQVPADRRKKSMKTRFGDIHIANSRAFSDYPNGFCISPYLQEKLVFLRQLEVHKQASELAHTLLGVSVCASQIDRLTAYYGAPIDPDLRQPVKPAEPPLNPLWVVYAQADEAMLLTDAGHKEAKLSRLFAAIALKASVVEERGGHIESSVFVGPLGRSFG